MDGRETETLTVEGSFNVNQQLHNLLVPISSLHEDPDNARAHDERNTRSIAESYSTFGQQKPIICDALGRVIAGNGQLEAARDMLGWTHIACIRFDDEDEAKQMAFALADNKTAELATWNFSNLSETLAQLQNDQELLDATGFAEFEIEPLLAADWSPTTQDGSSGEGDDGNAQADGSHLLRWTAEQWAKWTELRIAMQVPDDVDDVEAMLQLLATAETR
jgi:ParB-like chromosome segregation protein Spo0J